jgi:hypothetical protein
MDLNPPRPAVPVDYYQMSDLHVLTADPCCDRASAQGFLPPPSPGSSGDGGSSCVLFELHGMPYFYLVGGSSGVQRVPVSLVETRASCRVSCELSVLLGLLNGTLKPLAAVASGKLRVTGDRSAFRAIGNTPDQPYHALQALMPCMVSCVFPSTPSALWCLYTVVLIPPFPPVLCVSGPSLRRAAKQFSAENPDALGGRLRAAVGGKAGAAQGEGLLLGRGPDVERLLLRLDRSEWEDDAARRQCTLCHKVRTSRQAGTCVFGRMGERQIGQCTGATQAGPATASRSMCVCVC